MKQSKKDDVAGVPTPVPTTFGANGLPVKQAFLHQSITWPGFGAEKTISVSKFPGGKFSLIPQGLLIECKGQKCVVPMANVVNAILE